MLKVFLSILLVAAAHSQQDAVTRQLPTYKSTKKGPIEIMTTSSGAPVEYTQATSSLNTELLTNEHLFDDLTSFVRSRIPERIVHASGVGAFGRFIVTNNISRICNSKVFSEDGKETPIVARFSLGFSRSAIKDTSRETRGFAVRFYTEEGNLDLTGLSAPIFAFNEPLLSGALRAVQTNPATNIPDPNMLFDVLTLVPESLYSLLFIFSDYGTPLGYPYMPGHPVHTYHVYNDKGESHFVRFHFIPEAGVKNMNSTEALAAGSDLNYYARGLYNAIASGNYPCWFLKVQILTEADVKKAKIDVFDVTNDLPEKDYPYQTVGKFVLNKNPDNHHAQIEQLALSPGNIVRGILGGVGGLYKTRSFMYRDSHNYRLGGNSKKIPVNCPLHNPAQTYTRDGLPPVNENGGGGPNYYPNSFSGPVPYVDAKRPKLYQYTEKKSNNFKLANNFYSNILTSAERESLINNLVQALCLCEKFIQNRAVDGFSKINSDFGAKLKKGLATCSSKK